MSKNSSRRKGVEFKAIRNELKKLLAASRNNPDHKEIPGGKTQDERHNNPVGKNIVFILTIGINVFVNIALTDTRWLYLTAFSVSAFVFWHFRHKLNGFVWIFSFACLVGLLFCCTHKFVIYKARQALKSPPVFDFAVCSLECGSPGIAMLTNSFLKLNPSSDATFFPNLVSGILFFPALNESNSFLAFSVVNNSPVDAVNIEVYLSCDDDLNCIAHGWQPWGPESAMSTETSPGVFVTNEMHTWTFRVPYLFKYNDVPLPEIRVSPINDRMMSVWARSMDSPSYAVGFKLNFDKSMPVRFLKPFIWQLNTNNGKANWAMPAAEQQELLKNGFIAPK